MTDKEKIREEVEKIAKSINPFFPDEDGKNSEYEAGRFAMVTQIMQIIDSLQEEPVSNPINFEQELYKAFGQVKDFTLGMRIAKWFYDIGYHQAEKDLELTWEDIEIIVNIDKDTDNEESIIGVRSNEEHYREVLKRFKDLKEREEK